MNRIKVKIGMTLLMILALVFQSFTPLITYAQTTTDQVENEEVKLYEISEDIEVEEGIILNKGTLIYGQEAEEGTVINLQYADTYIAIPQESLAEADLSEDERPLFTEVEQQESSKSDLFSKNQSFYAIYPDENERITLTEDSEYPVYQDESGMEFVYFGNTAFYLSQQDRQIAKETIDEANPDELSENEEVASDEATSDIENGQEHQSEKPSDDLDQVEENEEKIESEEDSLVEDKELTAEQETEDEMNTEEEEDETTEITTFSTTVKSLQKAVNPWQNASADYFKVDVDNLIVYAKGNTKKIGSLTKGQVYPIDSNYGNWHQIQFGNTKGYVYKADTTPAKDSSLKNKNKNYKHSKQSFVALQNASVYDNTSGKLVEFGKINKGERYPIVSDYGTNWSRVIFADRVGYVLNSEVRHEFTGGEKHFTVLNSNLPVYDNRSGKLKQVGTLTKGQAYEIVSDYGNWHRIQYNNHYGYVSKAGTEPSNGAYIRNENKSYNHSDRSFTAFQDVIVYDNTGGKLKAFGTIDKGQTYYIASDYGNWWRVVFADRVGYVQKDKVRFNFFNTDKYFENRVDALPVYDNSTGRLIKIGELKKGQVYPRISNYGAAWHKVQFGDGYGYVYTEGTDLGNKSKIKNLNSSYKNSNDKIVANGDVEVMDNTSGKLVPFGKIADGTIYPIASDYGGWWRIIFMDRVGYVNKDKVANYGITETNYDISLDGALEIQKKARAQTDKEYKSYISKEFVNGSNKVTAESLNVRGGPGTNYWVIGTLKKGAAVEIVNETNGWYEIEYTGSRQWVNASPNDILYYLNPKNFVNDERQKFQFLDLSKSSDAPVSVLNNFLKGKGILSNQGQAFLDASRTHGINDIYLVSHAMLETGNGTSTLATGVKHNGVTVYNMFGIGAYDSCPTDCGAKKAYEEGWTTPYKAIVGGAKFIGNDYIKNSQNTLYKMRWNPAAMAANKTTWGKQYATDIGWAAKQVNTMFNLYELLESYTLYLDIPVYRK